MPASNEPMSFDDLLEHADWVRGLALRLVRDAARADDLVQEAWVTALESPPRHASNLRAWLGAVVTRAAQSEWRSDRRRTERERRGSRPEALAATDQLVHEAQLSSELVEAVVTMEEPYKTVLLLRYFRDRKPAQIARELDRPLATVKTQVQRGLERLRGKLDDRHGDRRSWCLALVPLARGGAQAAGLAALGPAVWIFAAGVAVIALWAAALQQGEQELGGADPGLVPETLAVTPLAKVEDAPIADTHAGSATREVDRPQSVAAVADVLVATEGLRMHVLSGRVLDLDSEPLSGHRVRWVDSGALRWLDESRSVVTGADTFVPISDTALSALLSTPGALEAFARDNFSRPDLALALLRQEAPPTFEATTDADGWFSMEVPGSTFELELLDAQSDVLGRSKTAGPDGEEVDTWFASRRRTFRGTTVDGTGEPVAGALVVASGEFPQQLAGKLAMGRGFSSRDFEVTSDAAGEFEFADVSLGRRVWLSATKGELERAGVFLELPEDAGEEPEAIRIELFPDREAAPRLVLRGRVLLDGGSPAPRATVVLGRVATTTDSEGRYRLALRETSGDLFAGRAGEGIAVAEGLGDELAEVSGQTVARDLVLPRTSLAIGGRLVDGSGAPVAGARVHLADGIDLPDSTASLEDLAAGRYLDDVETDADGRFLIDGLAPREYRLGVRLGERRTRSEPFRAGERGVVITLP